MGGQRTRGSWGLAAALLSSCFLLIQATEIVVQMLPWKLSKGQDVTLTPEGKSEFVQCSWYRGKRMESNLIVSYVAALRPPEQQKGPRFTGREVLDANCSLHISHLMPNDTEIYAVSKTVKGGPETGHVHLDVPDSGKTVIASGVVVGALAGAMLIGVLF